jgi:hypothetical protein
MALRFIDGFDHSGTSDNIHATKYTSWASTNSIVASPVRTGTGAVNTSSTNGQASVTKPLTTSGAAIVGVACRFTAVPSAQNKFLDIREGATVHVALAINTSMQLVVRRDATVLATGATVLALNTWYYLELKTVIHDTTGTYEVHIDGVTEITGTGADTRNGGAGTWDRVALISPGVQVGMDDLYVADDSGSVNNNFLGIVKVETLLPQTGNGTNTGFTPSTGSDRGALVDENPPNTTDYNTGTTAGQKDTYNYPALSLSGNVLGVQTNLYTIKTDAGARTVAPVVRIGATDYDGTTVSPLTTYSYFSELRELNPNSGVAWTTTDVGNLEAGMKVVS